MAISFITGLARQTPTANTSFSHSLDCGGADFLVVSEVYTAGETITCTYNGVSLVKALDVNDAGNTGANLVLWVLKAPAAGNNTLAFTTSSSDSIRYAAGCYLGVNQSNTVDSTGSLTNSNFGTGNVGPTITTIAANCWTVYTDNFDGSTSADSFWNTTARNGDTSANTQYAIYDSNAGLTAGSNTLGKHFTNGTGGGLMIVIGLAPAGATTALSTKKTLLGVGV